MFTNRKNCLKVTVFATFLGLDLVPKMSACTVNPYFKNDFLTLFKSANGKLTFESCNELNSLRSDVVPFVQT